MNTNDFAAALTKLAEPTAKTVHLTPQEARAVLEYIQQHGLRADLVLRYWQRGKTKPVLRP